MLTQAIGVVADIVEQTQDMQILAAQTGAGIRQAIAYSALVGLAEFGDQVLLNTTARELKLGTGGYDFVIANLTHSLVQNRVPGGEGHIIKGRYLPCQQAVLTLEEQPQYADVWERKLDSFPVLVGQLHSQIAPAAAGLQLSGKRCVAYIMTDQAALPMAFSRLARELVATNLLQATLTCGQAFGGEYETVTLHSALLAAKHILECDAAIVCQGPGNVGTGTKYGFSGIEQAQNLDIVDALGGTPIAIVRMSSADKRLRHLGISHHTRTTLELVHARCIVPLPTGTDAKGLPEGNTVQFIEGTAEAVDLLTERGITVTTMGRTPAEDPAFFCAAAAAGLV